MTDHLRIEARFSGKNARPAMHVTLNGVNVTKHVEHLGIVTKCANGGPVDLATVNATTYPVEYVEHDAPRVGRHLPQGTLLWSAETPGAARLDLLRHEHLTRP